MIISQKTLAGATLGLFAAGIVLSMAFNLWNTETTKNPARFSSGTLAGQANPADIRGSYTLADISAAFPVDIETLAKAFRVPLDGRQGEFQVKNLEELYGEAVETDSVRLFTALWTGRPHVPEETTRLLPEALELLKEKLSSADWKAANAYSTEGPGPQGNSLTNENTAPEPPAPSSGKSSENTAGDPVVRGNTTFGELLLWGLTEQEIKTAVGGIGAGHESVRNWTTAQGKEFSTAKTALQALLDTKKP